MLKVRCARCRLVPRDHGLWVVGISEYCSFWCARLAAPGVGAVRDMFELLPLPDGPSVHDMYSETWIDGEVLRGGLAGGR